jgi:FMN phosphatase YigB (HAD superfamily)
MHKIRAILFDLDNTLVDFIRMMAAGNACNPILFEPFIMSILLELPNYIKR